MSIIESNLILIISDVSESDGRTLGWIMMQTLDTRTFVSISINNNDFVHTNTLWTGMTLEQRDEHAVQVATAVYDLYRMFLSRRTQINTQINIIN